MRAHQGAAPAIPRDEDHHHLWQRAAQHEHRDQVGNLTFIGGTTYTYDAANRLTQIGSPTNSYSYDEDKRWEKWRQGGYDSIYLLWSPLLSQPLVEITSSGTVFQAFVSVGGDQAVFAG